MVTLIKVTETDYFIDGCIDDDDFFLNTDSELIDLADAEEEKDAAVYSVPVSLKQSILDELAQSKFMLETGVIGSFDCTRLIQLVSVRIDAERSEEDGETVITPESCEAANSKLREWKDGDMKEKVGQVKKQLAKRVNRAIEENNTRCLQGLCQRVSRGADESDDVKRAKAQVKTLREEMADIQKRLTDAQSDLKHALHNDFLEVMKQGGLSLDPLPENALAQLRDMS